MIVTDTMKVNTEQKLQILYAQNKLKESKFLGRQHYILDHVPRLSMDVKVRERRTYPNIEYPFIEVLLSNYDMLKIQFKNCVGNINETEGWHYDMKFLFYLTRVFRFLETMGYFKK